MKKLLYPIIFLIIIQCGKNKDPDIALPQTGGKLRISYLASLENLDPQKMIFKDDVQVGNLIYEGLVRFKSKTYDVEPALAKSWKKLDHGSRLQFILRDSIYFHENACFPNKSDRKVTVDDIIYTFHRLCDPTTKSPFHSLFSSKISGVEDFIAGKTKRIRGIKEINHNTIEFQLDKPYVSFMKLLATPAAFIVSKKAIEYYGENFKLNPIGTGPFRMAVWKPLQSLTLMKNSQYWEKDQYNNPLPYLDRVEVKLLSNPAIIISQFQAGELDVLTINQNQYHEVFATKDSLLNIKVAQITPSLNIRFWGFSLDSDHIICQNAELRQTIAKALNREDLSVIKKDTSILAHTLIPPIFLSNKRQKWYPYHIGQFNNAETNQSTSFEIATNIRSADMDLILTAFDALGISYTLNHKSVNYYNHIFESRPELFRVSFLPSFPDVEEYYHLFYSKATGVTNITGYKNTDYDLLYEKLMVTENSEQRQILMTQLEAILKKDVPVLYMTYGFLSYHLTSSKIKNFEARYNGYFLNQTWISRDEAETE